MTKVSVIIVTFNNQKTIKKCLDSVIGDGSSSEIIVVDNKSEDETVKILKEYGNKIALIEEDRNLGFAKANNNGFKKAKGEYLLFLNPDAEFLSAGTIDKLLMSLSTHADYGIIGPQLISPSGVIQKSVRNLPSLWRAVQEFLFGNKEAFDFYLPQGKELLEVESIVAACIIIKKSVFEKVGKFDEKYFLYFEDLQLCKDIRNLGLKIGYDPSIVVEHAHGISGAGKNTNDLSIESARNYHGYLTFLLIQIIGRLGNKLK